MLLWRKETQQMPSIVENRQQTFLQKKKFPQKQCQDKKHSTVKEILKKEKQYFEATFCSFLLHLIYANY